MLLEYREKRPGILNIPQQRICYLQMSSVSEVVRDLFLKHALYDTIRNIKNRKIQKSIEAENSQRLKVRSCLGSGVETLKSDC